MADELNKLQVFTLDNLKQYDGLIKNYVDTADAKSLKTVAIDGNKLYFYRSEEPIAEGATPAYTITLPETDVSKFIEKLTDVNTGEIVIANEDGTLTGSDIFIQEVADVINRVDQITDETDGVLAQAKAYTDAEVKELADGAVKDNADAIAAINNAETGILKQAQDYADGKVGAVEQTVSGMYTNAQIDTAVADAKKAGTDAQADVDALEGVVSGMYTNTQIDEAIEAAKTAATYDDTELRGLISDNAEAIEAHKTSIDNTVSTLVGEDTGKSVRTIANEELAAQLIGENAKESLDTLEEIAAWIQSHPDDASAMNKAIEDLEALVGALPDGVTATTIVGYIQEAVAAEKARAEEVEGDLDERLTTVEGKVGEAVDTQITNAIAGLDADVTSATVEAGKGVQVQVIEVDGKVTTVAVTGNYDEAYDAKGAAGTAETNAKTYADGLNTAMDARATALEEKVGDGYEAIPESEINALFGITE